MAAVFALMLLFDLAIVAGNQKPVEPSAPLRIRAGVALTDVVFPQVQADPFAGGTVELEPVPGGRAVELELSILNATARNLSFGQTRTSCGCISFRPALPLLAAGQSMTATVSFTAPPNSSDGAIVFSAESLRENGREMRLLFRGQLSNNLHLPKNIFLPVADEPGNWRIPVAHSAPVSIATLRVETSPGLGDLVFEPREDREGIFLEVFGNAAAFHGTWTQGTIRLLSSTGAAAESVVLLARQQPVTLSPGAIRLRHDPVDRVWRSSLLARIAQGVIRDSGAPTEIRFTAASRAVPATSQRLAEGIYRISLELGDALVAEWGDNPELEWAACFIDGRTASGTVRVILEGE